MRTIPLFMFLAASALAQTPAPPAFDVASVKINPDFRQESFATWPYKIDTSPGTLTMRNVSLRVAIAWAYEVQRPKISGPAWMESMRYDIQAKAGHPVEDGEIRLMLRALLGERFKLEVHKETKQLEVLALLVPKGGHKMTPSQVERPGSHEDPVRGRIVEGISLPEFIEEMSHDAAVPIVDLTGLTGRFDFSFNVQKYVSALRARLVSEPHPPPESELKLMLMQDMLAGDLGLRLESRRAPVEIIVIDRAEKTPVEN